MSKKNFTALDNPALAFISNASLSDVAEVKEATIEVARELPRVELAPIETEARTKRVQLVVTPSLFDDLQILTKIKKTSLNNFTHKLLEESVRENKEDIEKYKKLFGV